MVAAGLSACNKAESDGNDGEQTGNTRFSVSVNDETLTAESVTVSVTCTGGSDTWYCFVTKDTESDIEKAIADELAGVTDYQSLLKAGNQSVTFNNLTERTDYRVIVTGLLPDGQVVGTADEEKFTTPLPDGKWIENENWSCTYLHRGDMTLEDGSKMYADILSFTIKGGDDYYLPAVVSVSEFKDDYNNDIAAFAKAEIAVVQDEIDFRNSMGDNAMWIDYALDYNMEGSLGVLDSDDKWYAVMLGVDLDGKGTGLYFMSEPFTPQEETAVPEYEKWIGTWRIADKNTPGYYYIVEITGKVRTAKRPIMISIFLRSMHGMTRLRRLSHSWLNLVSGEWIWRILMSRLTISSMEGLTSASSLSTMMIRMIRFSIRFLIHIR